MTDEDQVFALACIGLVALAELRQAGEP